MDIFLLICLSILAGIGSITITFFLSFWHFFVFLWLKVRDMLFYFRVIFPFRYRRKKQKRVQKGELQMFFIGLKLRYFFFGFLFSFLFLFSPLLVLIGINALPDITTLKLQEAPQTTKIYDRHHVLLYQIYATQNRTLIQLKDVPLQLQEATIAIEDKNFYHNPGFDIIAMGRALIANSRGKQLQGASTITQQLIKSALLSSERTISRKVEEVILAFLAEHIYNKKQILEMYFNQVPYGGTAWGVDAAAQTYFGKNVQDLDLAESTFLAGLPQAPSLYSPFESTNNLWKKRQREVLDRMIQLGYITAQQRLQAQQEQLHFAKPQASLLAPHFVMYIRDLLIQKYGLPLVEKGGLSVTTSLDLNTQGIAQQAVSSEIAKDGYLQLSNGAALVTDPKDGDILAMVGSKDYYAPDIDGNVNIATSLRQPGSSIKIVTYAAALSHGYTAATTIDDTPVVYKNDWETYAPVNYDGKFHGTVTVRTALANSFNIPAVKTLNVVGIATFVSLGKAMGISHLQNPSRYGLSLTLGSADVTMLDMAEAYGTLANQGNRVYLNPILSVIDNKGIVLEQKIPSAMMNVLDPGITYILSNILSDNSARSLEFGLHSPLEIPGYTVAVKTGTTDDKRDNWTDGYTPKYVVIVWVGNNDNSPMSPSLASGITGAAPIWHDIMTHLVANKPNIPFPIPSDITNKPCRGITEYFLKGTENFINCGIFLPTWTPIPTLINH